MKRSTFLRLLLLAPLGGRQVWAESGELDPSVGFLLRSQSRDGAWRSPVYGAFRDGRALTPVVLRCLAHVDHPDAAPAVDSAARWLVENGRHLFEGFPVHSASAVLEAGAHLSSIRVLREDAIKRLLALQGGPDAAWSYSPMPPPTDTTLPLAPMRQPNLSATAIAIDGLRAAGGQDAAIARALAFVRSCQNFGTGDPDFDDGGFFQMPLDPARNKAGQAGTGKSGKIRFRSYAAATADGLRSLLSAGCAVTSPEVVAARRWLDHFKWTPAGGDDSPADLAYYSARSIALTSTLEGGAYIRRRGTICKTHRVPPCGRFMGKSSRRDAGKLPARRHFPGA